MIAFAPTRRACRTVALALALSLPLAAGAQAASDSVTLPRELLLALLGNANARDQATLAVGRVPEGFPTEFGSAPGIAVLGGMSNGSRGPDGSARRGTAMLVLDLPPDSAAATVAGSLERGGWRRPPAPAMRERGGFVPSTTPIRLTTLCRGESVMTLAPSVRQVGGSYVRATLGTGRMSLCDPEVAARPWAPSYVDDFPFPALVAPPGATTRIGSGSAGGGDRREAYTRLEVDMTPQALLSHYATQLERAGWALGAPLQTEGLALRAGTVRDPQGRTWQAMLAVQMLEGGRERDVTLRVVRSSPR